MIYETIVTTCSAAGEPHVAPMGIVEQDGMVVLAPFRPSTTLDNVLASGCAVQNFCDDVRVFAGCVSGARRDWPTLPATRVNAVRLAQALGHSELELVRVEEEALRPRLLMRRVHDERHHGFRGFNRAQAAVIEAAILVSRLDLLPADKIDSEIAYLRIAIDKTAGERERQAWDWLMQSVAAHRMSALARRAS